MDFFNGPQFEAWLYRSSGGDQLLMRVSHLVCDAAGAKEIAAEWSDIYRRLAAAPDYHPEPAPVDYRGFWQVLRQVPWYAFPRIGYNYLCEVAGANLPAKSHVAPLGKLPGEGLRLVTRHIPAERFADLRAHARAHRATVNDLLVTAIIRALSKTGAFKPGSALRLGMAVDLRRYLPGKKARSLANFSSLELFNYGRAVEADFHATLERVARRTDRRKGAWIGLSAFATTYPLLWSMPFFLLQLAGCKGWEIKSSRPNAFDWLTNMGEIPEASVDFDGKPAAAWLLVPGCALPMLFFGCSTYRGALTFSWSVGSDGENEAETRDFFDRVVSELLSAGESQPGAAVMAVVSTHDPAPITVLTA